MDGLRWLLLIFGVLVVAGVYWYSRREASAPPAAEAEKRREPSLGEGADVATRRAEPGFDDLPDFDEIEHDDDTPAVEAERPAEKIVTLRIVAGKRGSFPGDELALGLRRVGMRHGKFGIFHRYEGDDANRIVFSGASLVEPGSFDLANLKEQSFPGISLFMVLPGPLDGAEAFDSMMAAARTLASALEGELLDESGSTLSIQRERYMREEIIQYQLASKVA